ncbi:MAG: hypothetical protein LBL55_01835, partial [Propionibacteriaceae bacterium]|nr:hypothetical protein [Propionibacteriaceae bacterium]
MCYYVTLALGGVTGEELNAALREAGLTVRFDEVTNHHVMDHLAADELYLVRGDSHCDCGTWLGEANRRTGQRAKYDVTERDLARLKAKGWSEQKIQRWLTEKRRATESD